MQDAVETLPLENRLVLHHLLSLIYDVSGGNKTTLREVRLERSAYCCCEISLTKSVSLSLSLSLSLSFSLSLSLSLSLLSF